ncbi:MAG TPA: hypothetical protein VGL93_01240 [Streptosporangiaceae bacterium]|jgi:hypothetical protein
MRCVPYVLAVCACAALAGCGPAGAHSTPQPFSGMELARRTEGGLAPVMLPYRPPDFAVFGDGRAVETDPYRPMRARIATLTSTARARLVSGAYDNGLDHARRIRSDLRVADGQTVTLWFRRATTTIEPGADTRVRSFGDELAFDRIARRDMRIPPRPYAPGRVAVIAVPLPSPPRTARAWPLAAPQPTPELRGTPCRTYTGAAAERAGRLLDHPTPPRYWRAGGRVLRLVAYPLLPGETRCADLARRP